MAEPLLMDASFETLVALGSIARHAEELLSPTGDDQFDRASIASLLSLPYVEAWMAEMDSLALLPVKR